MILIDTHAHIYLPDFREERLAFLERARAAGVESILMPAIDSQTHTSMLELDEKEGFCLSMMGLHPCSVKQDYEKELEIVEQYFESGRPFVAVGEIGLDLYWDKTYAEQQLAAFHRQVRLALKCKLPVAIHSRNATDECIDVVRQYPGLTGVFHCFSGTEEQARKVMELGFYLGIGGVVTFRNAGLDKVVQAVGLEQVILETDAPYLAPVPFRGKRNEPSFIRLVAEKIAGVTGHSLESVAEITSRNAKYLFKL